jgi:hypothetical protein
MTGGTDARPPRDFVAFQLFDWLGVGGHSNLARCVPDEVLA